MKTPDLVVKDHRHRLQLSYSPEISNGQFDQTDDLIARLLVWLDCFNKDILNIRIKYKISVQRYPNGSSTTQLLDLITSIKFDDINTFSSEITSIREKYRLNENWFLSIAMAITTHTLLVPPKLSIGLYMPEFDVPKAEVEKAKNIKDIARSVFDDPAIRKVQRLTELAKHPSIYFNYNTSIDELIKWINKNRNLIRFIQSQLSKKRELKREAKTLFWGQVAWTLMQDGITSWTKMTKVIQEMLDKSDNDNFNYGFDMKTAPDPTEFEKYYTRFLESLETINPT